MALEAAVIEKHYLFIESSNDSADKLLEFFNLNESVDIE